ncbi:hypothetical protein [Parasedimentitalea psychrophila]|uniref:Uncharacterized protein n=1 Tax=Parasedimentitalea psychrophila TaxID=2997337 RepID=A0A9Y2P3D6_9RHOB|nr:hypothetical protein [Parasedimentitalea psychrophila]WIY25937.1 hypothetical protein QPJ95_03095 [Parasedimentitalea psychrophila]
MQTPRSPHRWLAVAFGLIALGACTPPENNAVQELAAGGIEVQINTGRNCWEGRCLTYNAKTRSVQISPHDPIAVPAGVDLTDGYVSPTDFTALIKAAQSAPRPEGGGSSSGSSSGSGGATGGGSGYQD